MTKTYTVKSSATRAAKKYNGTGRGYTITGDKQSGFLINVECYDQAQIDAAKEAGHAVIDFSQTEEAPAPKKSKSGYIRGVSVVGGPCALVWAIADAMKEENPSATRKEIMQACMNSGVTYGTARTQYQKWLNR